MPSRRAPAPKPAPIAAAPKAKPVHPGRDFAKEVGIIVLGVLIALAGQQTVEWFHWRREVAQTREALDREVAVNLGAINRRLEEAPCMDRRLDELKDYFVRHTAGRAGAPSVPVGQPQFQRTHSNVWEVALAGDVMSHFSLEERLHYATLYDGFEWIRTRQTDESVEWIRLAELDDYDSLEKEDWSELRAARARAKALADNVDFSAPSLLESGRSWHNKAIAPGVAPSAGAKALCKALT
ncbi:MAG: hypothetical protein JWP35_2893 [Caulobacter sp.]|nr:hypothetical protein [Caulobacter sp.]